MTEAKTTITLQCATVPFDPPPGTTSAGIYHDSWRQTIMEMIGQHNPGALDAFTNSWLNDKGKHTNRQLDLSLYYYILRCLAPDIKERFLADNPNCTDDIDTTQPSVIILEWIKSTYAKFDRTQNTKDQQTLLSLRIRGNNFPNYMRAIQTLLTAMRKSGNPYNEPMLIQHILQMVLPREYFSALLEKFDDFQMSDPRMQNVSKFMEYILDSASMRNFLNPSTTSVSAPTATFLAGQNTTGTRSATIPERDPCAFCGLTNHVQERCRRYVQARRECREAMAATADVKKKATSKTGKFTNNPTVKVAAKVATTAVPENDDIDLGPAGQAINYEYAMSRLPSLSSASSDLPKATGGYTVRCLETTMTKAQFAQAYGKSNTESIPLLAARYATPSRDGTDGQHLAIIDSGAGKHCTGDSNLFGSTLHIYADTESAPLIEIADSTVIRATGTGTAFLQLATDKGTTITVPHKMLFVKQFSKCLTLLSTTCLARTSNGVKTGNGYTDIGDPYILFTQIPGQQPHEPYTVPCFIAANNVPMVRILVSVAPFALPPGQFGSQQVGAFVTGRARPFQPDQYLLMHRIYGHLDVERLCQQFKLTKPLKTFFCSECAIGKITRQPVTIVPIEAPKPGILVYMDLSHRFTVASRAGGAHQYMNIVDACSKSNYIGLLVTKPEALEHFKRFHARMTGLGHSIVTVVADNDKAEFRSAAFLAYLTEKGIQPRYSAPNTPVQNHLAERTMDVMNRGIITNLGSARLGPEFWGPAAMYYNGILENIPVTGETQSPREKLGLPNELHRFHRFGCQTFHHVFDKPLKMDPNALEGIYLMPSRFNESSVILNLATNRICETTHYVTDATIVPGQTAVNNAAASVADKKKAKRLPPAVPTSTITDDYGDISVLINEEIIPALTSILTPKQARESQHVHHFQTALEKEYEGKQKSQCMQTIPKSSVPPGVQILRPVIIRSIKPQPQDDPLYKVRISVDDSKNTEADFAAPTPEIMDVRIYFVRCNELGLDVFQRDAVQAFSNGKLDSPVYMFMPPGLPSRAAITNEELVVRIDGALEGLKIANSKWDELSTKHIVAAWEDGGLGLTQFPHMPCVYSSHPALAVNRKTIPEKFMLALKYVDDFWIGIPHNSKTIQDIDARWPWKMKQIGQLTETHTFLSLGMSIKYGLKCISFNMQHYIDDFAKEHAQHIKLINNPQLPLSVTTRLVPGDETTTLPRDKFKLFHTMVASALWVARCIQPILAYPVAYLSRLVKAPTEEALQAAVNLWAWLTSRANHEMVFRPTDDDQLTMYVDSDWAGDALDRHSVSGGVILWHGAAIMYYSTKQTAIADSSAAAEIMSIAKGTRTLRNIRNLLKFLGSLQGPTMVYEDNAAALQSVISPFISTKLRHLDLADQISREAYQRNEIAPKPVTSAANLADCMTKATPRPALENSYRLLMGAPYFC